MLAYPNSHRIGQLSYSKKAQNVNYAYIPRRKRFDKKLRQKDMASKCLNTGLFNQEISY